ncbi:MAG TPA: HlyD family efflux transporter periplasmic adaptor subunit [Gemmatimonadaceae bacterium]|nr:HlyD family efflux transporter periplasmic adaptor subunit [Gemmatimonadaceae bacterium]
MTAPRTLDSAPFLDPDPPHWAARGLAYFLLAVFAAAAVASVVVRVPETISGTFALVPERGTDPLRAMREGVVAEVRVAEGQQVGRGEALWVVRSQPAGERSAELQTLRTQAEGTRASIVNAGREYESRRQADQAEAHRLETRLDFLARTIELKRRQAALAADLAARYKKGAESGAMSGAEYSQTQLEADRLTGEVTAAEGELADTREALGKLRHELAAHDAEQTERARALRTRGEEARIRIGALEGDPDAAAAPGGALTVTAPCAGTVLRMRVNSAGAVVQPGETLGEIACSGSILQAEMRVPQAGVAFVRPGQGVKLLYDAFPYQRYGVRFGTVRWVGPSSANNADSAGTFRALIEVDTAPVRVRGEPRPLMPGMGGRADVVIGRRTLASFAFEPLRQLKESFAEPPAKVGGK